MKLSIRHDTSYSYASDVSNSIQFLRLTPRSSARQRINEWQLGLPCKVKSQIDPYGNILHVLTLDKPHGHLALTASGQVEIDPWLSRLRLGRLRRSGNSALMRPVALRDCSCRRRTFSLSPIPSLAAIAHERSP